MPYIPDIMEKALVNKTKLRICFSLFRFRIRYVIKRPAKETKAVVTNGITDEMMEGSKK